MKYYNNKYPNLEELVMCTIRSYEENIGFTVTLDEYDDIEGLLVISNLSRKKLKKNPKTVCKNNSKHILLVSGIEGDNINLSKKDVNPGDMKQFSEFYGCNIKLATAMNKLSHISDLKLEDIYTYFVWPNLHKPSDFSDDDSSEHLFLQV